MKQTFKFAASKQLLLPALMVALLSGCNLMPAYERPANPAGAEWPSGPSYKADAAPANAQPVSEIQWRTFFADERLRKVVELALANNRDLRVSTLNIERARAQYRIERAGMLPNLDLQAGESASRTPAELAGTSRSVTGRSYSVSLGMSAYELDFFGRVRSLSEAALQTYLGTEEARRSAQIALVAEVANAYLTLAADQERLVLAQDTLKSQQLSLDLSEKRFQAGATSGLDRYEARTTVETARSDVAAYTSQVALDQNALALVVGAQLAPELLPAGPLDTVASLTELPSGVPSDVLQRRPDVLEAERSLRAANANIGAARAAFFPSITLTASAGTASTSLSGLFKGGSSAWSFAPALNLPIFDGGVNSANLKIARVEREISVAQYEKAVQTAFREVADALAQRGTLDERLASQQAMVDASGKSYQIYQARYKNGADSYLNALISQRSLYAAQQNLISTRLSKQSNLVTLYKVLGGGWQPEGVPVATAAGAAAN